MKIRKQYISLASTHSSFFRMLHRKAGWTKGYWTYWADGAGGMGMGSTARAAKHDARKRRNW